jgi:CheY-like chemotaxis protein
MKVSNASRGRILVVDDDENVRMALSYALKSFGFEVVTATNEHEGLHQFEALDSFTVVMIDCFITRRQSGRPKRFGNEIQDNG